MTKRERTRKVWRYQRDNHYPFGIFILFLSFLFWSLYGLALFYLRLLMTPFGIFKLFFVIMFLALYCVSFGLRFWLSLQSFLCLYVLAIVLCVLRFTLLITPSSFSLSLCSCNCIVCSSVYGFGLSLQAFLCLYVLVIVLCVLRFTASDYPFNLFLSLCSCHCIVCPSVYGFWLPLQTFLVFMLNIKTRQVWRGNQKPYTEGHTIQW
jgi:hypothetical protein